MATRVGDLKTAPSLSVDGVALWAMVFVAFFAAAAVALGPDASWDFRNYHFYNGFAAHHDRSGLDIFPAQLQTAMFRGVDAVYYSLITALNGRPRVLVAVLSLPYAAAAVFVFLIGRLFVDGRSLWRGLVPAAAALVGLTGAATLPTLSSTQSDVVPGVPLLIGLALWLTLKKHGRDSIAWAGLAGALGGLSVGLKLTQAPLFVGMFVAIGAVPVSRRSVAEALMFGLAGVAAFAVVDGAWLIGNWHAYGNPIFPLRNDLFRSDLVQPTPWTDTRFLPKTPLMALVYPAYWAFRPSNLVSEFAMRDPRVLIGGVGSIVILAVAGLRRLRGGTEGALRTEPVAVFLAIATLLAIVLWEAEWSIYRYLAIEEALSGVIILAAATMICGRTRPVASYVLFAVAASWVATTTVHPWWDRAWRGDLAVSVALPPIEPDAMALILDPSPLAYVVPFLPETARAIGVDNNLTRPGDSGGLRAEIEAAVRDHRGPLWGIENPSDSPGVGDRALMSLGLARGDCAPVASNLEPGAAPRICRLVRLKPAAAPPG